jgi:hypothetical protein
VNHLHEDKLAKFGYNTGKRGIIVSLLSSLAQNGFLKSLLALMPNVTLGTLINLAK